MNALKKWTSKIWKKLGPLGCVLEGIAWVLFFVGYVVLPFVVIAATGAGVVLGVRYLTGGILPLGVLFGLGWVVFALFIFDKGFAHDYYQMFAPANGTGMC
ncbi:MAG: hypothetical protein Q8N84_03960 [bacterium]|nr:hypothetical protein [bacterium]